MRLEQLQQQPWALWRTQLLAVLRLEWRRSFFNRRGWWIYLLAFGPTLLALLHALVPRKFHHTLGDDTRIYATLFQLAYLRMAIFFGCVAVFGNLFRAEMLEKTLHYYFLSPVRREVIAVGKFLAGLIATVVIFGLGSGLTFLFLYAHRGDEFRDFLFAGAGLSNLAAYLLVTALACLGYGAVFLLLGMLVKNPMFPAAILLAWESINAVLPAFLQRFSVIHYLKALLPVDVPPEGPLALIAVQTAPVPAYLGAPGILLVTAVLLAIAARRVRTLEISYTE